MAPLRPLGLPVGSQRLSDGSPGLDPGPLLLGVAPLTLEAVAQVALGGRGVALDPDPGFRRRVEASRAFLAELLARGEPVYGVNTGYGDSCTVPVPPAQLAELPAQLCRYHGCGMGAHLEPVEVLAVLLARLTSLAQGYSAVRFELLEALAALINHRILPRIPAEGSVGASGDLTPLSYVAAVLMGEREVLAEIVPHPAEAGAVPTDTAPRPARAALEAAGLPVLVLAPKEALALMNGTAVMTGLACLAYQRAEHLSRLACRLTSLSVACLQGHRDHFHPRLSALKPHAGQGEAAAWIWADLAGEDAGAPRPDPGLDPRVDPRLQDRYSLRCAPHVIGVLRDALPWIRRDLEHELNSANDNPLFDGEARLMLHGGHFYGGHVAFAMDALKLAVAGLADLMDRQLALLVDPRYNGGLPANLSGAEPGRAALNHGLKAVQIGASAWTAEALKLTMPASAFSRSTECHNQDKVSLGTIAARDCLRVLELTEQVAAAMVLATRQGLELRARQGDQAVLRLAAPARAWAAERQAELPLVAEDRSLEAELRALAGAIHSCRWSLYP
jgi:histidine ammonia-lyase